MLRTMRSPNPSASGAFRNSRGMADVLDVRRDGDPLAEFDLIADFERCFGAVETEDFDRR